MPPTSVGRWHPSHTGLGAQGPALLWPRTGGACLSRSVLPDPGSPPTAQRGSEPGVGREALPAGCPLTRAPLCGCGCGQQVAAWSHTGRPCSQPRERRRAPRVLAGRGHGWAGLGQRTAHTERGLQHEGTILLTPAPPAWPGQHVVGRPHPAVGSGPVPSRTQDLDADTAAWAVPGAADGGLAPSRAVLAASWRWQEAEGAGHGPSMRGRAPRSQARLRAAPGPEQA